MPGNGTTKEPASNWLVTPPGWSTDTGKSISHVRKLGERQQHLGWPDLDSGFGPACTDGVTPGTDFVPLFVKWPPVCCLSRPQAGGARCTPGSREVMPRGGRAFTSEPPIRLSVTALSHLTTEFLQPGRTFRPQPNALLRKPSPPLHHWPAGLCALGQGCQGDLGGWERRAGLGSTSLSRR